ncbi:GIN domain-containing protein [Flavobacterium psychrotrophum]|uniref:GIN domain-containing protein n=1 Tax=Flavobacterium psychrotrophum TaxID=2294119 RepID=UPI000E311C01|nr:DUF2807 domain-containing protein [Flavobacterium psychrotrophum]
MKQLIIIAITALTGMMAQAQVTETRTAKPATTLEVKNGIEVIYTQGNATSVKVEANNREALDNVATEFKGNTLKVYIKNQAESKPQVSTVRVFVTQPQVTGFKVTNGAVVKATGILEVADADIKLETGATFVGNIKATGTCRIVSKNGSGFRGTVNAGKFKGDVTAGGYIKISGSAADAQFFCSSASIQAGQFICKSADVMAKNASAVAIYTDTAIKISTDASSSITYYGEPAQINLGDNAYSIQRATQKLTLN